MQIYQPEDGYCYNSDTLFLYDFAKRFMGKGNRVLEVGSGSGVLGLLLGRDISIELVQVEKQMTFVELSRINSRVNGIESEVVHRDFLEYDSDKSFDVIVSNPPFYHNGVVKSDNEMLHIARYNHNLPIEAFVQKAARLLGPRGRFIFCYDPQEIVALTVALQASKFTIEDMRYVYPKEGKMASLVMIHARRGSKAKTKTHPPLFGFTGEAFSDEAKQIYKSCRTQSIKVTL